MGNCVPASIVVGLAIGGVIALLLEIEKGPDAE